jgi:hypothetical protein
MAAEARENPQSGMFFMPSPEDQKASPALRPSQYNDATASMRKKLLPCIFLIFTAESMLLK